MKTDKESMANKMDDGEEIEAQVGSFISRIDANQKDAGCQETPSKNKL
jgi:hypothetical protein